VPFFRWVIALGLLLFAAGVAVYTATPDYPETKQIDLVVYSEKPDGACTVAWDDPYAHKRREGSYLCDPDRDDSLKTPWNHPQLGWDSGWMISEGPHKGDLYAFGRDDAGIDRAIGWTDNLVGLSALVLLIGAVGGNIRSLYRLSGANPALVRRARQLEETADRLVQDHAEAIEAVRTAWRPLQTSLVDEALGKVPIERLHKPLRRGYDTVELRRCGISTARDVLEAGTAVLARLPGVRPGAAERLDAAARGLADDAVRAGAGRAVLDRSDPRSAELLNALGVLVRIGPEGRRCVQEAAGLAAALAPLNQRAAPAGGRRLMMRADRDERWWARQTVPELRRLLARPEHLGAGERFTQLSIDLLRGPDADVAGIASRVDYENRPVAYAHLLTELAVPGPDAATER
jgi:hypothetical protein